MPAFSSESEKSEEEEEGEDDGSGAEAADNRAQGKSDLAKQQGRPQPEGAPPAGSKPPPAAVSDEARRAALEALRLKRARGLGAGEGAQAQGLRLGGAARAGQEVGTAAGGGAGAATVVRTGTSKEDRPQLAQGALPPQQSQLPYPSLGGGAQLTGRAPRTDGTGGEGGEESREHGAQDTGEAGVMKKRRLGRGSGSTVDGPAMRQPPGKENQAPVVASPMQGVGMELEDF